MTAYYNEIDPYAAQWLRNLIAAGHIAAGVVDERSIVDVSPDDLREFDQCHFFAGIGVWSYALRRAGWSDSANVWTGSCPCQPFSAAGKGGGFDDERHLWPAFHHLIKECRPDIVLGEQVASKDGLGWLDLVQSDLEGTDYAFGAVDSCSAGFGAPHIRQRLYWMADAGSERRANGTSVTGSGSAIPVASAKIIGTSNFRNSRVVADANEQGGCGRGIQGPGKGVGASPWTSRERPAGFCEVDPGQPGPTNGLWSNPDWLFCWDGKWRPVEPGTFPLAHGATSRVGRLRAYGNAINAEQATAFCEVVGEALAA